MNLKEDHLYVYLFKDILKIEFAKNTSDPIKHSMASIGKKKRKTADKNLLKHLYQKQGQPALEEATGDLEDLPACASQEAPGRRIQPETLLGEGKRAIVSGNYGLFNYTHSSLD